MTVIINNTTRYAIWDCDHCKSTLRSSEYDGTKNKDFFNEKTLSISLKCPVCGEFTDVDILDFSQQCI